MPELAQKCIASWKQYFPEYEVKEWNETNYDVHKIPYISEAYTAKRYAFVSDYVRFDILYQYGGIYFDTDVEVIKPFDDILSQGGFMGMESVGGVAAGLGIGCNAGLGIVYQILQLYAVLHFLNSDGTYNLHTVVEYVTKILKNNGLKNENTVQCLDGLIIYPPEYFAPKSAVTGDLYITKNTHSIHHYDASWVPESERKYYNMKRKLCRLMGQRIGTILAFPCFLVLNIRTSGIKVGLKKVLNKITG
ncbi:glycosyl transferase [Bacilli bacterium]|nr:glycosyl transferase [Bacilli bacterium]